MEDQLKLIKKQKQNRFREIMDNFAKAQLQQLEKDQEFWQVILKSNQSLFLLDDTQLGEKKDGDEKKEQQESQQK